MRRSRQDAPRAWLVALALGAASAPVAADGTLRCGSKLVRVGMPQSEVLALCGEPTARTVEIQDVRTGNRVVGTTSVQRWTYESYASTRVLVFDEDTLKSIE